ncbi:TIGR03936 family radical SAM-associated protein [Oscillospiraceae bacterium LTW-04]|nr:TIGR03936 family radical SAM-associated protein [Oscillospiraceae bacterium MB24-C1]
MYIKTVRIFFSKSGRAIYISHLDLMRAMTRAFSRSGLPVWYTQGFHPHLYITFALPLSLGTTGLCESMDVRLLEEVSDEEIISRLNAALPEGVQAVSAGEPVMAPKEIMWADYHVHLRCVVSEGRQALERFVALEEIPTQKRSKKGMKTVDIKPMLKILSVEEQSDGLMLKLRCRAGVEINLNPTLALDALTEITGFKSDWTTIERFAILNEALENFK